ncbi:MAG: tape measure protein, partial [Nitrospiraceae bacterium]|nr:tape measure protein [Nitrospiraceae bacterium]
MSDIAALDIQVKSSGITKTTRDLHGLEGQSRKVETATQRLERSFSSLKRVAKTVFAGWMITQIGRDILETSNAFVQFRMTLRTLEGGIAAANKKWAELLQFAQDTPFRIGQVMTAYKTMKAYGLDPTISAMRALGDTAAVMGGDTLPRIAVALGQINATGKVSAQDLNQLSQAGINVDKALKGAFNVGRAGLDKLNAAIASGAVSMKDVYETFLNYMRTNFGGQMEKMNNTLKGQWEVLISIWQQFEDNLVNGKNNIGVYLTVVLKGFNQWLDTVRKGKKDLAGFAGIGSKGFSLLLRGVHTLEKSFRGLQVIWDVLRVAFWKLIKEFSEGLAKLGRENAKFYRNISQKALDAGWIDTSRALTGLSNAFLGMAEGAKNADANLVQAQKDLKEHAEAITQNKSAVDDYVKSVNAQVASLKASAAAEDKNTGALANSKGVIKDVSDFVVKKTKSTTADVDDLWTRAMDRVQHSFSDTFYDMFHGKLHSFKDLFKSFVDDITRYWSEKMAKLTMGKLFGSAGGGSGFSNTGGWMGSALSTVKGWFGGSSGVGAGNSGSMSNMSIVGGYIGIGKDIGTGIAKGLGLGGIGGAGGSLISYGGGSVLGGGSMSAELAGANAGYTPIGTAVGTSTSTGGSLGSMASYGGQIALGASAVYGLAKGNYAGAAVDAAALAASYIPVVGWAIAALMEVGKFIHGMLKKKPEVPRVHNLYEYSEYSPTSGWGTAESTRLYESGKHTGKLDKTGQAMAAQVQSVMNIYDRVFKDMLDAFNPEYVTRFTDAMRQLSLAVKESPFDTHGKTMMTEHGLSFTYHMSASHAKDSAKKSWARAMQGAIDPIADIGSKLLKEAMSKTVENSSTWSYLTDDFKTYLQDNLSKSLEGLKVDWSKVRKEKDVKAALEQIGISAENIEAIVKRIKDIGKIFANITDVIGLHGLSGAARSATLNLRGVENEFE